MASFRSSRTSSNFARFEWDSRLVLRAGCNRTDDPIQARDVTFNILQGGLEITMVPGSTGACPAR
jgi:hypothetical protein